MSSNFKFTGTVYVAPPSNAVNFSFFEGNIAAGFQAARLGIPALPIVASGLDASVMVGAPSGAAVFAVAGIDAAPGFGVGVALGFYRAAQFQAARFGVPSTPLPAQGFSVATAVGVPLGKSVMQHTAASPIVTMGAVTGWFTNNVTTVGSVIRFGEPDGPHNAFASGFNAAQFGVPAGPHNVAATSLSPDVGVGIPSISLRASGWSGTALGSVQASYPQFVSAAGWASGGIDGGGLVTTSSTTYVGQQAGAFGWSEAVIGEPAASWDRFEQAAGSQHGVFGIPLSGRGGAAAGIFASEFGAALSSMTGRASSTTIAGFGAPKTYSVHQAASANHGVTVGAPAYRARCGRSARGLYSIARFGVPERASLGAHAAASLNTGRRFGQPTMIC